MKRRMHVVCAIAVGLAATAGCTLPTFTSTSAKGPIGSSPEVYFDCSLNTVAQNTRSVLDHLGIGAVSAEESEKVVFHCTTQEGIRFDIILRRGTKEGVTTWVDFAWEGTADVTLRREILTALLAANKRTRPWLPTGWGRVTGQAIDVFAP